jgi:hypothetical protein
MQEGAEIGRRKRGRKLVSVEQKDREEEENDKNNNKKPQEVIFTVGQWCHSNAGRNAAFITEILPN